MDRAACRGSAPRDGSKDIFFPGPGETSEAAVLKFCFACRVRAECGQFGDDINAKSGVWGGRRRTRNDS